MTTPSRSTSRRLVSRRAVLIVVAILLATVLALGAAWQAARSDTGGPASAAGRPDGPAGPVPTASPSPTPTPTPTRPPDASFSLLAAGDVLPHTAVIRSAATATGFDFGSLLQPLDTWVQAADLALCHLEVPVAPPGTQPTGYPAFGAPGQLVDALRAQGWDGCSTASNHSLDRGLDGVRTTLDALDAAGLGHAGTARTAAEAAQPQVYRLERAGQTLTVAHLAGTYGLNGVPVPPDAPWSVALIDPQALVDQATAARAAGADVVVVSVHCCQEYVTSPAAQQVDVAQALADSGAVDLVIGHHAHVPQPVTRLAGGPRGEGMWVFHGLGNLLSNQDVNCCPAETSSGLLASVHVTKAPDGPARVTAVEWTGVTVDRFGGHQVFALPDVTAGTATLGAAEVAAREQRVRDAAGVEAPERTTPMQPTGPPPVVVERSP